MSRALYILAATLIAASIVCFVMSLLPESPTLPGNTSSWHSGALLLLTAAFVTALLATLQHLFEQVERRKKK